MSLAGWLGRRAAADPEAPWLFFPSGFEWRWHSWRQVADRVARAAESLAALPSGPVAFRDGSSPDAVAAVLAIEAAGRTAVPFVAGLDIPEVELPAVRSRLERWTPVALPSSPPSAQVALPLADLLVRTGGRRPILTSAEPAGGDPGRLLLAAALASGAAWALAPRREELPSAVGWTRPTAVAARREERRAIAAGLSAKRDRWSRLRLVVALDQPEPGEEEAWASRGTTFVT